MEITNVLKQKYRMWFFAVLALLMVSTLIFFDILFNMPWGNQRQMREVNIPQGASLRAISDSLQKKNIIRHPGWFQFAVQLHGASTSLRPGIFALPENASFEHVIRALTEGNPEVVKVTIIEGLQSRQIAKILATKFPFTAEEFNKVVHDSTLAHQWGIQGPSLEGFLYPETYKFFKNQTPQRIAHQMVRQFFSVVPDSFRARAKQFGWTLRDAVTMASIIEGEAMRDDERQIISSVYHNRLNRGMRLQADPTIQYIIEDGPRRLWDKDLEIESPYNTYLHSGLPPGPINNPGFGSIKAALFPAHTNYLYFVARGDGYHTFSRTNREHINAKRRLQQLRRQVAQEKHNEG